MLPEVHTSGTCLVIQAASCKKCQHVLTLLVEIKESHHDSESEPADTMSPVSHTSDASGSVGGGASSGGSGNGGEWPGDLELGGLSIGPPPRTSNRTTVTTLSTQPGSLDMLSTVPSRRLGSGMLMDFGAGLDWDDEGEREMSEARSTENVWESVGDERWQPRQIENRNSVVGVSGNGAGAGMVWASESIQSLSARWSLVMAMLLGGLAIWQSSLIGENTNRQDTAGE